MPRKKLVITGQVPTETPQKDLTEIITEKRLSKFGRFGNRDEYKKYLHGMGHIEICEELMRLGSYPSVGKMVCIERCLATYDRAQAPRKAAPERVRERELQDIIKA